VPASEDVLSMDIESHITSPITSLQVATIHDIDIMHHLLCCSNPPPSGAPCSQTQAVKTQQILAYSVYSHLTLAQCTHDVEHSVAAVDNRPGLPLFNSTLHQLFGMLLHA
jgi:hypothetical protein